MDCSACSAHIGIATNTFHHYISYTHKNNYSIRQFTEWLITNGQIVGERGERRSPSFLAGERRSPSLHDRSGWTRKTAFSLSTYTYLQHKQQKKMCVKCMT